MRTDTLFTAEELSEAECWSLLLAHTSGRIAVARGGEPGIFPVDYAVAPGGLLIRTGPGSKLLSILLNGRVAFEIDERTADEGWSVVVHGWAEELDPDENHDSAPDAPFAGAGARAIVRIMPTTVTGRTFRRS